MKIVEYKIFTATYPDSLTRIVNEYIQKNWQPYGDLMDFGNSWVQTMVRYESDDIVDTTSNS